MSSAIYPTVKGLAWTVLKTPSFETTVQSAPNRVETRIQNSINPIWKWELVYEYLYDNFNSPNNTMNYSPVTDLRELMGFYLARSGQYDDFLFPDPSDNWVGPMTWQPRFDFNPGTTIIDAAGHAQLTTNGGQSGFTVPTFNDVGGTTLDNSITWADQGAFTGANGQFLQVVTDGLGNYYSPLQRNMGSLFNEDVTDLNTSMNPFRVWVGGTLKTQATLNTCSLGGDYTIQGPGLTIPGASFQGLYLHWCAGAPAGAVTTAFNFYFRVRFATDDLDFEQFMQELWTIGGGSGKNGRGTLELMSARSAQL